MSKGECLVTGAAGFIGARLCRSLVQEGYRETGRAGKELAFSPQTNLEDGLKAMVKGMDGGQVSF